MKSALHVFAAAVWRGESAVGHPEIVWNAPECELTLAEPLFTKVLFFPSSLLRTQKGTSLLITARLATYRYLLPVTSPAHLCIKIVSNPHTVACRACLVVPLVYCVPRRTTVWFNSIGYRSNSNHLLALPVPRHAHLPLCCVRSSPFFFLFRFLFFARRWENNTAPLAAPARAAPPPPLSSPPNHEAPATILLQLLLLLCRLCLMVLTD